MFIIIPPACWGANVSVEIYELLLLFSIITPWKCNARLKRNEFTQQDYLIDSGHECENCDYLTNEPACDVFDKFSDVENALSKGLKVSLF